MGEPQSGFRVERILGNIAGQIEKRESNETCPTRPKAVGWGHGIKNQGKPYENLEANYPCSSDGGEYAGSPRG